MRSLAREAQIGIGAVSDGKNDNSDPGTESSESSWDEIRFIVSVGSYGASKHFSVIVGI